jgi:predicted Rossmann-fold nucleotide-binding protein
MRHDYWKGLMDWLHEVVLEEGKISAQDLALMRVTDDPEEVVDIVCAAADLQGWDREPGPQTNDS